MRKSVTVSNSSATRAASSLRTTWAANSLTVSEPLGKPTVSQSQNHLGSQQSHSLRTTWAANSLTVSEPLGQPTVTEPLGQPGVSEPLGQPRQSPTAVLVTSLCLLASLVVCASCSRLLQIPCRQPTAIRRFLFRFLR